MVMFCNTASGADGKRGRRGSAAVECAICAPLICLIVLGLLEVGRITAAENVIWNCAREGARDASTGEANLQAVASNLLIYLQGAEPSAFPTGHSTSMIAPVVSLPANTSGYTCWDTTANQELFTMTFTDLTNTSVSDPTGMSQLDRYQIGVQVPYSRIGWLPTARITGITRLYAKVTWAALVDSPFEIAPDLPAQ
jgi:Flp pilus assembly protein TadG